MTEEQKQLQELSAKLVDTMCMLKSLTNHYAEHISKLSDKTKEQIFNEINVVAGQLRTEAILTPNKE